MSSLWTFTRQLSFTFTFIVIVLNGCKAPESNINESARYLLAYNVGVNVEQDDYDVFVMNLDGSNKQNVTNHPDVAWSYISGKNKVYFISDRDTCKRCFYLYSVDPDGTDIQQISDVRLKDSWMGIRNNEELIIKPHQSIDSSLYVINSQGYVIEKIHTGAIYSSNPSFSPDGETIAFSGSNKKSKREEGYREEIYKIGKDRSDIIKLTNYPESDTTAPWYAYKAGPPKWHPTENFISYQSYQNGKYSLYAVITDGSKQWKLTENSENEGWHDWSPDGFWLAIEVFNDAQNQFHIALMNWKTKELNILTDTTYIYQQSPSFISLSD